MPEFGSPSDIAREVLRRLAMQRLHPTPENFRQFYDQIAGSVSEDEAFPERHLKQICSSLPRATPEQLRVAQQFETAIADSNWQVFKLQLISIVTAQTQTPINWVPVIRDLVTQWERRQLGLSAATKQDALERVLENHDDPAAVYSRLTGLVKGWAQLPTAKATNGNGDDSAADAPTPVVAVPVSRNVQLVDLQDAPEGWREVLAHTLEHAVGMLLIDTPELTAEATELAGTLRNPGESDGRAFDERLKRFSYKVQWVAQDQSYIRQALLKLLQLIIENISELVIDDKWLQGQMGILLEMFSRPLDKNVLEEMGERLRDVILKQGSLKRSLSEAQSRLHDMLASFIDRLGELADSTGAYHGKVSVFAQRITQASSLEELSGLVEDIMHETKLVEQNARTSQKELKDLRATVDQANREIARLGEELEQASALVRHDPLTGSLNRKGLEEMMDREIARSIRRNTQLCLAMLDVDNFKNLNDTLGHTTGDEALKHLAMVIRENIRPQDSSGRYGGEEFLLLLPDTSVEDAVCALQRLQRELTKRFFLHGNQKVLITFSAGVTELKQGETAQIAIDRADQAMYRAKRSGKNRVEFA
jgi:diguanylate cyclase